MPQLKFCKGCNSTKSISSFGKHSVMKDGFRALCKECVNKDGREKATASRRARGIKPLIAMSESDRKKSARDRARAKRMRANHKIWDSQGYCPVKFTIEGLKECSSCGKFKAMDCFNSCKKALNGKKSQCNSCTSSAKKSWAKVNAKAISEYSSQYRKDNKPQSIARMLLAHVLTRTNTPKIRLTESYLGYNFDKIRSRLEFQFRPGMHWGNHGEWEVDHKKPISRFIKQGVTDPAIINALSNLQPLWKKENRAKGDKWNTL